MNKNLVFSQEIPCQLEELEEFVNNVRLEIGPGATAKVSSTHVFTLKVSLQQ